MTKKVKTVGKLFISFLTILFIVVVFQNCTSSSGGPTPSSQTSTPCTGLSCSASKYSIFAADLNGSNVSLVKTSGYQEMTHIRVSSDKNWITYTSYDAVDSQGCANEFDGYLDTEIRAIHFDRTGDKNVILPNANQINGNDYWIGSLNEFSYLSGTLAALQFNYVTVNSSLVVTGGPTQIPIPSSVTVAVDPQTNSATNKIVFAGMWNSGSAFVKSIFIMNLSDSSNMVGLSLGRDHSGTIISCSTGACTNIMENDPKISPDGTHVAFMRQAPSSGVNGFNWHIFVVPVASPLNEVDISWSTLGSDLTKAEGVPEWIDNNTLIFFTDNVDSSGVTTKNIYTMKSDGTQRTQIALPGGFLYTHVFPFTDGTGKQRLIVAAEKIGAPCSH